MTTAKDGIGELCSIDGLGNIFLGGALGGAKPFSSAYANGVGLIPVKVELLDSNYVVIAWERVRCTYVTAGNQLVRGAVMESSNGGALVNFGAGTKRAFVFLPVADTATSAALSSGLEGKANTSHTHLLAAGATDVTVTAANLNTLDDGVNTALHFHDADRSRGNHTGTQAASTISGLATVATTGAYSDLTGAPAAGGSGGSPGGSSTQPQYNNAGAFAGMSGNYYPPGSGGAGPASNGLLALAGGLRVGPETHNAGISNGCGYFSGALEVDGDFYLGGSFIPGVNVAINLQGSAVTSSLINTVVAGETSTRFFLTASGGMQWSSGSAAYDVTLTRGAAGRLDIGGALAVSGNLTALLLGLTPEPVGTLPTPIAGRVKVVNDAISTTPRSIAAGTGSSVCLVLGNGTNWLIV